MKGVDVGAWIANSGLEPAIDCTNVVIHVDGLRLINESRSADKSAVSSAVRLGSTGKQAKSSSRSTLS